MKIQSWNCCGFENQRAIDILSHLVREKFPKILFFMETKQSVAKMRQIQAELPYQCMLAEPSIRRCGDLALLCMDEVDLYVQTFTLNHINALIMNDLSNPSRLIGFYSWPESTCTRN